MYILTPVRFISIARRALYISKFIFCCHRRRRSNSFFFRRTAHLSHYITVPPTYRQLRHIVSQISLDQPRGNISGIRLSERRFQRCANPGRLIVRFIFHTHTYVANKFLSITDSQVPTHPETFVDASSNQVSVEFSLGLRPESAQT